jgi:hypothetical protein
MSPAAQGFAEDLATWMPQWFEKRASSKARTRAASRNRRG